jgi:hypothetical protein
MTARDRGISETRPRINLARRSRNPKEDAKRKKISRKDAKGQERKGIEKSRFLKKAPLKIRFR